MEKLKAANIDAYPQEVLADEEPKYLRRQKPLEIKRRKFGKKAWKSYARWSVVGVAALAVAGVSYMLGHFLLASKEMALERPDQIRLAGAHYVPMSGILEIFRADRNRSVLRIPLDGAADHGVSEALYLRDPDGNDVELFVDVAGVDWKSDSSLIAAPVKPLAL